MHAQGHPGWLEHESERPWPHGMDHALQDLDVLLREARAAGRRALLPALDLDRMHNFGKWYDWQWDWYFNLGASRLIDPAGDARPLPIARDPPPAGARTLIVGPGESIPALARGYPRLVRRYATSAIDPPPGLPAVHELRLDLVHSKPIRDLARETVAEIARLDGGRFVALHVRRGDRLWQYPQALTAPEHLGDCLRARIPDRSVVFVMSDERDPGFWEPLRRRYRLVRYADIPRLAALVSGVGDRRPDNYLLYEVENAIAASAWMRISTFPRKAVPGRAGEDHAVADWVSRETNRWRLRPVEPRRRTAPADPRTRPRAAAQAPPAPGAAEYAGEPIWYNDWRRVPVPLPGAFKPSRPVSVVVPCRAAPGALERTLGALEGQIWPRELIEVVVVGDASTVLPALPARPASMPLDVKVVRCEDREPGPARARNAGGQAAAHDILVFLDAGVLPEAGWLAAHARWHHVVSDALTIGFRGRVEVNGVGGVDAPAVNVRPGSLAASSRRWTTEPSWIEPYLHRTGDLTSRADDPFRVVEGATIGIGRGFYELLGASTSRARSAQWRTRSLATGRIRGAGCWCRYAMRSPRIGAGGRRKGSA